MSDLYVHISENGLLGLKEAWENDSMLPHRLLKNRKTKGYTVVFLGSEVELQKSKIIEYLREIASYDCGIALKAYILSNVSTESIVNEAGTEEFASYNFTESYCVNILEQWHLCKCRELAKIFGEDKLIMEIESEKDYIDCLLDDMQQNICNGMEFNGSSEEKLENEKLEYMEKGTIGDVLNLAEKLYAE